MSRMAFCRDERTAISPAKRGASAAPALSTKYWTAKAVLRTSGRVIS